MPAVFEAQEIRIHPERTARSAICRPEFSPLLSFRPGWVVVHCRVAISYEFVVSTPLKLQATNHLPIRTAIGDVAILLEKVENLESSRVGELEDWRITKMLN